MCSSVCSMGSDGPLPETARVIPPVDGRLAIFHFTKPDENIWNKCEKERISTDAEMRTSGKILEASTCTMVAHQSPFQLNTICLIRQCSFNHVNTYQVYWLNLLTTSPVLPQFTHPKCRTSNDVALQRWRSIHVGHISLVGARVAQRSITLAHHCWDPGSANSHHAPFVLGEWSGMHAQHPLKQRKHWSNKL